MCICICTLGGCLASDLYTSLEKELNNFSPGVTAALCTGSDSFGPFFHPPPLQLEPDG